jgi:pimeloyl-ACP methyl ester carboxylesterase
VLAVLLALPAWNLAVTQWRLARNVPPGQYYVVEGRRMYMRCAGNGSPTVVIESGLSSDSFGWYGVQTTLAKTTRVCAYDRSGLGFSEPRTGTRDAEAIARQLHTLLGAARIDRPFIGLGWSAGGLYLREYVRQFPEDVAALALIESSIPHQLDLLPDARSGYESDTRTGPGEYRTEWIRVWSGWERLMGRCWNGPADDVVRVLAPDEAARLKSLYVAKTCRPAFVGGELGELLAFDRSTQQAARLTSIGDTPLLVVTEDTRRRTPGMSATAVAEKQIWEREQESLKRLSTRSWRVIANGSGHPVHHDRPDVIVAELVRLTTFLRGGAKPPFGSTAVR